MKKLERTRIWRSAYTEGWTDGLARHLDNEVRAENKALQAELDTAQDALESAFASIDILMKQAEADSKTIRDMQQRTADAWFQENQG